MMEKYIFLLTWLLAFSSYEGFQQFYKGPRIKREASGSLQIVTNHAQPIHADVKSENAAIGITEKVTAPEDTIYEVKSLRKSLPEHPSKVELVRNIGRVITLAVLLVSAVLEFYPLLQNAYHMVYKFLYL